MSEAAVLDMEVEPMTAEQGGILPSLFDLGEPLC